MFVSYTNDKTDCLSDIIGSLLKLDDQTNSLFQNLVNQTNQVNTRIKNLNQRVDACDEKIQKITSMSKKALTLYSSSTYPGIDDRLEDNNNDDFENKPGINKIHLHDNHKNENTFYFNPEKQYDCMSNDIVNEQPIMKELCNVYNDINKQYNFAHTTDDSIVIKIKTVSQVLIYNSTLLAFNNLNILDNRMDQQEQILLNQMDKEQKKLGEAPKNFNGKINITINSWL